MADTEKVRDLQSKVMRDIAAGAIIPIMMIGDDLDLFEKLYKLGPCSSENFSKNRLGPPLHTWMATSPKCRELHHLWYWYWIFVKKSCITKLR